MLEEKLLRVLKDEDASIKAKVDSIRDAVSREAKERAALGSSLQSTMDDRFKSLIEVATKDAVQEVSGLFQQEKLRMRDQFNAYEDWPAKLSALKNDVEKMDSISGLPNLAQHILAQCEQAGERRGARIHSRLDSIEQAGVGRSVGGSQEVQIADAVLCCIRLPRYQVFQQKRGQGGAQIDILALARSRRLTIFHARCAPTCGTWR